MQRVALSPGKLILSGEHAVVQGCPALAMAINLEVRAVLTPQPTPTLTLQLPKRVPQDFELKSLPTHLQKIRLQHQKSEKISPEDLLAACAAFSPPQQGGTLSFSSSIPLGSGLGSSAAYILAVLKVLHPQSPNQPLFAWAVDGENFQHGKSSGLDVATSLQGGCIRFQSGVSHPLPILKLLDFEVYTSGQPESSTGECVSQSREVFEQRPQLKKEFTEVTEAVEWALSRTDVEGFHQAIRKNHRLLCEVGVVPREIQDVISKLESAGCSAKICGAGSVKGEAAGIILVTGDAAKLVPSHWIPLALQASALGTRLV